MRTYTGLNKAVFMSIVSWPGMIHLVPSYLKKCVFVRGGPGETPLTLEVFLLSD